MFTQGLDTNALKWVQKGLENEVTYSASDQISHISPRNGVDLSPLVKFRSGNLYVLGEDIDEKRISTYSNGEVYDGLYSRHSSPMPCYDPLRMRSPAYHMYSTNRRVDIEDNESRVSGHTSTKDEKSYDEYSPSAPAILFNSVGASTQEQHTIPFKTNHVSLRADVSFKSSPSSGSSPSYFSSSPASLGAYHECHKLCLAHEDDCLEARLFLTNQCALLRSILDLQQVLPQSEENLQGKRSLQKPKNIGREMKVKVIQVRMALESKTRRCPLSIKPPKANLKNINQHLSTVQSKLSSGWQAVKRTSVRVGSSLSRQSLAYMKAGTKYIKQVSALVKPGASVLRKTSSANETMQVMYVCLIRLKSSAEWGKVQMQPSGSDESHTFLPDILEDDLIIEVQDSKGNHYGRAVVPVSAISQDPKENLGWWPIYREPGHEVVGKIQLDISYTSIDDSLELGSVTEAEKYYDIVLEVATKLQKFQQRNLSLDHPWKWLLNEFASEYGVSDAYTRLRYLCYIMEVATPTADCLPLVYDLLLPVMHIKSTLSHQENRMLGKIEVQIKQMLARVFNNYKSLDEQSLSGIIIDEFRNATGLVAPVLVPAVQLYTLIIDILSPEAQNKLYGYFQDAAKDRCRRHMTEINMYISGKGQSSQMDHFSVVKAYQTMISVCHNIRNEISTDIEIHNSNILPSFIDLPNISSAIFSAELASLLRAFLVAFPPTAPSRHVNELITATIDFQKDLLTWNINPVQTGVDAKELFHSNIMMWIQNTSLSLLETCKLLHKVKWTQNSTSRRAQDLTSQFVNEMYGRLTETLNDYDFIIRRWPEYTFDLENVVVDIENAVIEALDKQYASILTPLKESKTPMNKCIGLKCVQKLAKRTKTPYLVPPELGILLNSVKRMLDVFHPKIEHKFKSWGSCYILGEGNVAPGKSLSEVTMMLRSKFRNYLQAIVEKLVENTRLQNGTKLKKILQNLKEDVAESENQHKMRPLTKQLTDTINHLHTICDTRVFIETCQGYWNQIGQEVMSFLEQSKENSPWYEGSRVAVPILDATFRSRMERLLGNMVRRKDLESPRSIVEVRSMLCLDVARY